MGSNNIKFTQEQVEEVFRAKKCILQDIYKNANTPLKYICLCGKENYVSFDKFRRQKHGCRYCTKIGGYTHEEVFDFFEKQGCKLISNYTGCKDILEYVCKCGNINKASFDNFIKGKRCIKCGREKSNKTLKEKGNDLSSIPQKYIHKIIGGFHNYSILGYILDIAFIEEKICIEYDGGGHNLCVKKGYQTQEDFDEKEIRREARLEENGWKTIRIISKKDKLPNKEKILEIIIYARKLLEVENSVVFDIQDNTIKCQSYISHYDFGETKRIRNDCIS